MIVLGSRSFYPRYFPQSLREHFEIVFSDLRQWVPSPEGFDISTITRDTFSEDIDAVRQAVGFDRPIVAGQSQNGAFALEYARLFTDIVESSQRQAAIGDRAWRDLVLAHHATVREALAKWDGTEHDTAGDGFFCSFVGPARAIHCAREIADRVAALGLETRAAVHIGECEVIDGKPGGVAVTIAARALGQAGGREVIVTQTVKDLVAGSGFKFDPRGEHDLKGVPERWRLYAVGATS